MKAETLISELIEVTRQNLNAAESLRGCNTEELNWKRSGETWSILECIRHLTIYGDFYLPEIRRRIENGGHRKSDEFKTGVIGNYFVEMIRPKEQLKKIKTKKTFDPADSCLDALTIIDFIDQQKEMLNLLDRSRQVNLTKVKTAISISKLLKLRLGDTMRFVIYHNQRHLIQARNVQKDFNS